jgi:hypothetical protein
MNVLYVDLDGQVRAGWLTCGASEETGGAPSLVGPTGDLLGPHDVRSLLAPRAATEDEQAALWRAHHAGFRVRPA